MATFSVSTVRMVSSCFTASPSFFSQEIMVAFSWSISTFGMITGVGILIFAFQDCADFALNILFLGNRSTFQNAVIGDWNVLTC